MVGIQPAAPVPLASAAVATTGRKVCTSSKPRKLAASGVANSRPSSDRRRRRGLIGTPMNGIGGTVLTVLFPATTSLVFFDCPCHRPLRLSVQDLMSQNQR